MGMGLTPTQRDWLHHLKTQSGTPAAAAPESSSSNENDGKSARSINSSFNSSNDRKKDDDGTDLVLVCLSSQGSVYVYSPWQLLSSGQAAEETASETEHDEIMDNGMASLLLGDVWAQLRASFLPLTKPIATLSLTVPLLRKKKIKKRKQHDTNDSSSPTTSAITEQTGTTTHR